MNAESRAREARVDDLLQRAHGMRHEDTRAALALCRDALDLALSLDYAGGVAWGLLRTGLCELVLGDDDAATAARLQQAAALMRSLGDIAGEGDALNLLASLHDRRNEHLRALELREACLAARRRAGDAAAEAGALHNLALTLVDLQRWPEAMQHLNASLAIAERTGDALGEAYAHKSIGMLLAAAGGDAEALPHLERSLACVAGTRDRALESTVRVGFGRALAALGREAEALPQLAQALALARRTGNREDLWTALVALGDAQVQFGRTEASAAPLEEALRVIEPTGDRDAEASVLTALGRQRLRAGDHAAAVALLERGLAAADAIGAAPAAAVLHRLLADAHEAQGRLAAALSHLRRHCESEARVHGADSRRQLQALMTAEAVRPLQRDAQAHAHRAERLASELDATREWARQKEALLEQLAQQAQLLEQLAREDGLTGVANRRWLDLQLARECERASRFGHPLAVAMIDVDDFKAINDRHSHAVGDAVLRRLALLLRDSCRVSDQVGRYGGEEFMLVLPETTADNAMRVCEKLCRRVEAHDWRAVHGALARVTVSVGVAASHFGPAAGELAAAADAALYRAKQAGKNRVEG